MSAAPIPKTHEYVWISNDRDLLTMYPAELK